MKKKQLSFADDFWQDTGLNNRVADLESMLDRIKLMDTLTPEDWSKILDATDDFADKAEKMQIYVTNVYQRMIGD